MTEWYVYLVTCTHACRDGKKRVCKVQLEGYEVTSECKHMHLKTYTLTYIQLNGLTTHCPAMWIEPIKKLLYISTLIILE